MSLKTPPLGLRWIGKISQPSVETSSFSFQTSRKSIFGDSQIKLLFLFLLVGFLTYWTQGTFVSSRNLTNLSRQVSINGILAVGMTLVILIRGIDLSVGSVVAFSGVAVALLQTQGFGLTGALSNSSSAVVLISSLALAVAIGLLCGLFNGWMVTRHRMAPFIVSLGVMVMARGLALVLSGGAAISPLNEEFNLIGQGYLNPVHSIFFISTISLLFLFLSVKKALRSKSKIWPIALQVGLLSGLTLFVFAPYRGIPFPVLIFAVLALGGSLFLRETRWGRFIYAFGGNPEAAWLAGVPTQKLALGVYGFLGALAGLSGALLAARLNAGLPTSGELFELDAIAAVVIGGTSLLGGVGGLSGTVFGVFFIGVLNNGMSLLDVSEFYQKIIKGMIIVLAVWSDQRGKN